MLAAGSVMAHQPPPPGGGFPSPPPPPQNLPGRLDPGQIARDTAKLNQLLNSLAVTRFTPMAGKWQRNQLPAVLPNATDPFSGIPISAKASNRWPSH